MSNIIIPPLLKAGDTIGIVSPSKAPLKNDYYQARTQKGIEFLESLGLKTKLSPHLYDNTLFEGAKIEDRISDIHEMYLNPDIKMLMMIVGGQFANFVIDNLDYNLIKANPKAFSGFSDGTLLTNAIYAKSHTQTYYGINLNDGLGFDVSPKIKENFVATFMKNEPIVLTENKELIFTNWGTGEKIENNYQGWNIIKHGKASGELTGGLLQRLVTTDYAGYEIEYNNKVLFFESTFDLKNIAILLSSMKQKGIFNQLKALIVGYCSVVKDQKELTNMVDYILKDYKFPIVQIGELGHNVESYVYPIGANAEVDTHNKTITIRK